MVFSVNDQIVLLHVYLVPKVLSLKIIRAMKFLRCSE
jgi:hypothetical protein